MYSFYDKEEKRFRSLIRYSYYNQFIAEREFHMTGFNFSLEVAKYQDSTDGTKLYGKYTSSEGESCFDSEVNGKILSRRLCIEQSKLF